MYHFPDEFLKGLSSKSDRFQNKFFEIVDDISRYYDTEAERARFQNYIAENHSFAKPGNILHSCQKVFGGAITAEELKEKIHFFLLGLFDSFDASEAISTVPHIIVCISAPDGYFSDKDLDFLRNLLSFERVCRGCAPVGVTTIANDTENGRGISCLVVSIK